MPEPGGGEPLVCDSTATPVTSTILSITGEVGERLEPEVSEADRRQRPVVRCFPSGRAKREPLVSNSKRIQLTSDALLLIGEVGERLEPEVGGADRRQRR